MFVDQVELTSSPVLRGRTQQYQYIEVKYKVETLAWPWSVGVREVSLHEFFVYRKLMMGAV